MRPGFRCPSIVLPADADARHAPTYAHGPPEDHPRPLGHAARDSPAFCAAASSSLDLVTQAGTYVKEFCHGDFGRTVPNVGSLLGCTTDIMQLNVLDLQDEH